MSGGPGLHCRPVQAGGGGGVDRASRGCCQCCPSGQVCGSPLMHVSRWQLKPCVHVLPWCHSTALTVLTCCTIALLLLLSSPVSHTPGQGYSGAGDAHVLIRLDMEAIGQLQVRRLERAGLSQHF